jgi:hypothetical protein
MSITCRTFHLVIDPPSGAVIARARNSATSKLQNSVSAYANEQILLATAPFGPALTL